MQSWKWKGITISTTPRHACTWNFFCARPRPTREWQVAQSSLVARVRPGWRSSGPRPRPSPPSLSASHLATSGLHCGIVRAPARVLAVKMSASTFAFFKMCVDRAGEIASSTAPLSREVLRRGQFGLAGPLHASTIMPIRLEIISIVAKEPRLSWSYVTAHHVASHSARSSCTVWSVFSTRFSDEALHHPLGHVKRRGRLHAHRIREDLRVALLSRQPPVELPLVLSHALHNVRLARTQRRRSRSAPGPAAPAPGVANNELARNTRQQSSICTRSICSSGVTMYGIVEICPSVLHPALDPWEAALLRLVLLDPQARLPRRSDRAESFFGLRLASGSSDEFNQLCTGGLPVDPTGITQWPESNQCVRAPPYREGIPPRIDHQDAGYSTTPRPHLGGGTFHRRQPHAHATL